MIEDQQKYWKQDLVERDDRLAEIVDVQYVEEADDEMELGKAQSDKGFDAATFLYDLYKTSTVREIDDFKNTIVEVQKDVIEKQIKGRINGSISGTASPGSSSQDDLFKQQNCFIRMCDDLMNVNKVLQDRNQAITQMELTIKQIDSHIIGNIMSQNADINRLTNIQKSTQVIQVFKWILQTWQQVGYYYDFEAYRVLDAVALSHTLRKYAFLESNSSEVEH